jgi:hypothetical protein
MASSNVHTLRHMVLQISPNLTPLALYCPFLDLSFFVLYPLFCAACIRGVILCSFWKRTSWRNTLRKCVPCKCFLQKRRKEKEIVAQSVWPSSIEKCSGTRSPHRTGIWNRPQAVNVWYRLNLWTLRPDFLHATIPGSILLPRLQTLYHVPARQSTKS